MRLPIEWAEEQFRSLGRRDAHDLALELLAAYEGSALLANTLRDPERPVQGGTTPQPLDRHAVTPPPSRLRRTSGACRR